MEGLDEGVVTRRLEKYRATEYHYVHVEASDRERTRSPLFAESCVGQPYRQLSFVALGLAAPTGRSLVPRGHEWQSCVALVVRALERVARTCPRNPLDMMPADLAKHYHVLP
jgi:hypothetical protein